MLETPSLPSFNQPSLTAAFGGFPVKVDLSPVALLVVLLLAGLFFATISVILVYHWRRFPYEQETFDRVEGIYFTVSGFLLVVSLLFIWLAA